MLKKIGIGILLVLLVIVGLAFTKPDSFSLERSTTINAPADSIFPHLNDFHNWGAWSPWEKLDPAMARTHSGAASGPGAVYEWTGNSDVGSGRMEITDATPPSTVTIKLDFLSPMEAHNTTLFTLEPAGAATKVTWKMSGPNNFMSKVMTVFMSMDSLVGGDFEAGLANLKAVSEQ